MSRTDVLLVNPPSPDGHIYIRDVCRWGRKSREGMVWPQTSLAYLAAMVPTDMTVEIIDAIAERMSWKRFEKAVREKRPGFYVSYVTGTTFGIDARGIALAKELGATTIAIGTHPSAVPKDTLQRIPELDVVIRHEPEMTFRDVLNRVRTGQTLVGCAGTGFRDRWGRIILNEDRPLIKHLDELPIPKQHLLPLGRYRMPFIGNRYTWVLSNRGCPYRCKFCFEAVVWGKSVRYRSPESIIRELGYLAEHNVTNVVFLADLFTFDRKGVMKLCDSIIERGLRLRWACNSRVDTIDEEMARKMKQAGCWLIAFGIESGSQKVLDAVEKDTTVDTARQTIAMIDRIGVKSWGYFIIGLPGETEHTIRETISFAKSLPLDIALFHVAVPYAGTEFYFEAVAKGWLDTTDWSRYDMNDSAVVAYPELAADQIVTGVKQAFREFYLRPRQIWRLLKMLVASKSLGMAWDIARGLLSWLWAKNDRRAEGGRRTVAAFRASRSAVIEATHADREQRKAAHRMYEQVACTESGHE